MITLVTENTKRQRSMDPLHPSPMGIIYNRTSTLSHAPKPGSDFRVRLRETLLVLTLTKWRDAFFTSDITKVRFSPAQVSVSSYNQHSLQNCCACTIHWYSICNSGGKSATRVFNPHPHKTTKPNSFCMDRFGVQMVSLPIIVHYTKHKEWVLQLVKCYESCDTWQHRMV